MNPKKRFFFGGAGALLPVLVSFIALDINVLVNSGKDLSTIYIVGLIARYLALFVVGGFIAYLHDNEDKPITLVQLGIAAPALITSMVTSQATYVAPTASTAGTTSFNFSLINSAHASVIEAPASQEQLLLAAFDFNEFKRGLTGSMAKEQYQQQQQSSAPEDEAVMTEPSDDMADEAMAENTGASDDVMDDSASDDANVVFDSEDDAGIEGLTEEELRIRLEALTREYNRLNEQLNSGDGE